MRKRALQTGKENPRVVFPVNLAKALDDLGIRPGGHTRWLQDRHGLTFAAARNWFTGTLPEPEKWLEVANSLSVSPMWLYWNIDTSKKAKEPTRLAVLGKIAREFDTEIETLGFASVSRDCVSFAPNGGRIIMDTSHKPLVNEMYYVCAWANEPSLFVRRVMLLPNNRIDLLSDLDQSLNLSGTLVGPDRVSIPDGRGGVVGECNIIGRVGYAIVAVDPGLPPNKSTAKRKFQTRKRKTLTEK